MHPLTHTQPQSESLLNLVYPDTVPWPAQKTVMEDSVTAQLHLLPATPVQLPAVLEPPRTGHTHFV